MDLLAQSSKVLHNSLKTNFTVQHQKKSGQKLKQGRNLEATAELEAMEESHLWLVPLGLLSLLPYRSQGH